MNSSTMASVLKRSWMKFTRSLSASSSRTTEDCAIPTEASSSSGLTISGKRRSEGRCTGARRATDHEVRDADPLVGEHLLGERLVARQHQPLGRRPGVRQPQHLQHGGDRVVERRLAAEPLRQVEDDVGRLGAQARHQLIDVVAEAEEPHLVPLASRSARARRTPLRPSTRPASCSPATRAARRPCRREPAPGLSSSPPLIPDRLGVSSSAWNSRTGRVGRRLPEVSDTNRDAIAHLLDRPPVEMGVSAPMPPTAA